MTKGTAMSSTTVSIFGKEINVEGESVNKLDGKTLVQILYCLPLNDSSIIVSVHEEKIYSEGESISKLDDDALIQILCWLPLKDAARTSVLSRRWRYLWRSSLMPPLNTL